MFGISWDQTSGVIQRLLMFAAGVAVTSGWINEDQVVPVVGVLTTIIGLLWGVKVNTSAALVQSVDAIPGVAGVVPKNTPEGRAIAEAVNSPTVAVAGTSQAAAVARS